MELHNEVQKVFQFFIWNQWALAQTRALNQNQLGAIASSIDIGVHNKIVWIGFFVLLLLSRTIFTFFFYLSLSLVLGETQIGNRMDNTSVRWTVGSSSSSSHYAIIDKNQYQIQIKN